MSRKLVFAVCLLSLPGLAGSASGALVAHWPLNGTPNDLIGGLNWTLNAGATFSMDSKEGSHCLQTNGSGGYGNLAGSGLMSAAFTAKTITLWCKPNATAGTQVLYDEGGSTNGIAIRINNGMLEGAARNSSSMFTVSTPLSDTKWAHVALTFGASTLKLYLNGVEAASVATSFAQVSSHTNGSGLGARNGQDAFGGSATGDYYGGLIDDVQVYDEALSAELIKAMAITPGAAEDPAPATGTDDVPHDVTLRWTPGPFAATHDVYLGTSFADVNDAGRANPRGVLVSRGQTAARYEPTGLLEYGQTYYWRVDEVNQAPDNTIFRGEVWSLTVEPYAYPIQNVTATAASWQPGMGPENTVNGSGLSANDGHSDVPTTMWLSAGLQPNWIQYEFDRSYRLHELWVWNSNQLIEPFLGFGAKDVTIEYSLDGSTWTVLPDIREFSQAPGTSGYRHNTVVSFGGVMARYVKLTIDSVWGMTPQSGLSEVRFVSVPVQARLPDPATGARDVNVDAVLDWRPGRDATSHEVYLGTDPEAVAAGTVAARTVTDHGYRPDFLDFGTMYYWRVDEVNTVTYPGDVWDFTTQEYATIDDFESYTDQPGEEVFSIWIDGFTNGLSGSTVGYFTAVNQTFNETTVVHGGKQAMPFEYNNVDMPYYSEAERTFDTPEDWTGHGADTLVLYVQGRGPDFDLMNAATGPVIDGKVDAVWANVPALPIRTLINGVDVTGPADASAQFRVLYDSANLYVLVDVNDDALFNDSTNTWQDDSVEVYIDGDNLKGQPPLGGNARQNTFGWTDTAIAGTNTNTTGVVHAQTDTPTGWRLEIKFPWSSLLGAGAPVGKLIGIDCFYNDDDDGGDTRESQIAWHSTVGGDWQTPASWGTALVAVPGGAANADRVYVGLQDSSNRTAVVTYPGPEIMRAGWTEWQIPLAEFSAAGVKLTAVKKMFLGVGDRSNPKPGTAGRLFIDDIGYGHPAP
jgi:hypothetical protein